MRSLVQISRGRPVCPPVFKSFKAAFDALHPSWAGSPPGWAGADLARDVPISSPPLNVEPAGWTLATSSSPSPRVAAPVPEAKNPNLVLQYSSPSLNSEAPPSSVMAFQRIDPRPFTPRNMVWEEVPNRPAMVRAVASKKSAPSSDEVAKNDDLAIVTLGPLPGIELDFGNVEEVIRLFCASRRIRISEVQPCCLGQAYVRFVRALDRDILTQLGQIAFNNITIEFVKHDEGRNARRVLFNSECWI